MKLTRKHIGGLFDVRGGDGSWAHQLIDVKNGDLLFYAMDGKFWIEKQGAHDDWRPFKKREPDPSLVKYGWQHAKRTE